MNDPSNPYELTFEARSHYLYAYIKADTMTYEMALAYLREIADECFRLKYRRLMIHRDVPIMLSGTDLFYMTNDFLDVIKFARIAFVNPYTTQEGPMQFAMLVGTNRGGKLNAYTTVESAEKWLLEDVRVLTQES